MNRLARLVGAKLLSYELSDFRKLRVGNGRRIERAGNFAEDVPHQRLGNSQWVMQFTKQRLASVEHAPGFGSQSVNGVPVAKIVVIAVSLLQ